MLWPDGQVLVPPSTVKVFAGDVQPIKPPDPYDDDKQWNHLTRLLKAAGRGVRTATVPKDHVRIVVHIDCGGDWPVTKWYFDHLTKDHVDYDVVGQSFYTNYHGNMQNLRDNLRETVNRFHKDVMVVETAYPTRGSVPNAGAAKNMVWPLTPEGQKQFLTELIETVKSAPGHHGIGVNYWHPEATFIPNAPPGRGNGPDGNSLFDAQGNALPAMSVLK
ncbi:MAG: glycosyl hydrolase 53 family protein [Ignavibacteriota bacterium]